MAKATEVVFILDKSGSMGGLEADTIGGFNAMLKKQKEQEGACRVTTLLFNERTQVLHDRLDIAAVRPMDESQYRVGGGTALLDAIGQGIKKIVNVQKNSNPEAQAEQLVFVIITDGYENSSREFNSAEIKSMIEKREGEGWEFIFLGANIDAVETAKSFGIRKERAQDFHADRPGVALSFSGVNDAIVSLRSGLKLSESWGSAIREDYQGRVKGKPKK